MKSIAHYTFAKVVAAALSLLALSTFTRLLGPAEYGHYVLVVNSASLLALICFQWIGQCCSKYYFDEVNFEDGNLPFITELFQYLLVLSGIIVVLSLGMYFIYRPDYIYILTALLGAGLGLHELSLKHSNISTNSSKFLGLTILKSASFLVFGAVALYFYKSFFILVLSLITALALATPYFWKKKYWKGFPFLDFKKLRKYLNYSFPIILANTCLFFIDTSDRYFLNYFFDKTIVGVYSVNYDLVQFGLGSLISIISLLTIPMMFKSVSSKDHDQIKLNYDYINFLFVFVLYPSVWITVLFLDQIVTLTSGIGYVSNVQLLSLLLGSGLFFSAIKTCYFDPFFQAHGKTTYQLYVTLFGALINVVANFILIPKMGMLGAGVSTLISYASLCLLAKYLFKNLGSNIPRITFNDFKVGVCISIVGAIVLFVRLNFQSMWIFEFLVFAFFWACILYFNRHRILKRS